MRQNRKFSHAKQTQKYLKDLNTDLMSKFETVTTKPSAMSSTFTQMPKLSLHNETENLQLIDLTKQQASTNCKVLQKARSITNSKQKEIEKARKSIKKSAQDSSEESAGTAFLTGCGLYTEKQPENEEVQEPFNEEVDMNEALKYLVLHERDDLEELRRMIKSTKHSLKEYSGEVGSTQNQVLSAADMFGADLNVDLRIKISKCGLEQQNNAESPNLSNRPSSKRKISTSHGARRRAANNF